METKSEISAGGIVFIIINNRPQILLIKDKKGSWTFPKGAIEDKEKPQEAAIREIAEEAGITNISLTKNLGIVKYFYTLSNYRVKKTVYYFLFIAKNAINELTPQIEEGITEVKFFDLDEAFKIIGYAKTNIPVLDKIKVFFQKEEEKNQKN